MARAALTTNQIYELNVRGPFTGMGDRLAAMEKAGYGEFQYWKAPVLGSGRNVFTCPAQLAAQDVTTGITSPDFPRNVVATIAATTAADVDAVSVTVTGTDYLNNTISEVLPAFTNDTPGAVTGVKAFKTITRIQVPAMGGASAQVTLACGAKLGLKKALIGNSVILATVDGTYETTRPTVTFDKTDVSLNVIQFNTALNGAKNFMVLWQDMRLADLT